MNWTIIAGPLYKFLKKLFDVDAGRDEYAMKQCREVLTYIPEKEVTEYDEHDVAVIGEATYRWIKAGGKAKRKRKKKSKR